MSAETNEILDAVEERRLLLDVARMKERTEFHDVSFSCRDGVIVSANRAYLATRCEFFDRLLFGNMRESTEAVIEFQNVSSTSLRLVLEYLHTCRVTSLCADAMAVEAYDLARQYNLPGLQNLIVSYLLKYARKNPNIGGIISTALSLHASDVAESLLPVVSTTLEDGKNDLFNGFSVDALEFCLRHPKLRAGSPHELDIFKSVLHWAVDRFTKPSHYEYYSDHGMDSQWGLEVDDLTFLLEAFSDTQSTKYQEWRQVLSGVQFEKIPTHLLHHEIETLELVPVDILTRAYCNQATRFSNIALKSSIWDPNCRGEDVRIEQDLCDFQSKHHQGARTQTPFVCGIHNWEITIEKYCDLVWVGVVSEGADMNEWLGKQVSGWMFGSNGTLCHDTKQDNGPYSNKYGATFRENAVLNAKLDMNKRELGFIVNGVDYGVAFKNLPHKVYPAVSCRNPGMIKISFGEKLWSILDTNRE
eukprot:g8924.t1